MKSLYILYNQGVVFGYNENRASGKYGVYEKPIVADTLSLQRNFTVQIVVILWDLLRFPLLLLALYLPSLLLSTKNKTLFPPKL